MPHSAPSASADYAPIIFGVKAPRLLGALPDGRGQLWSADVKAVRPGLFCKVFAGVLFVVRISAHRGRRFSLMVDGISA